MTSVSLQAQEDARSQDKSDRLTEELGVEFVCSVTQSLFRSRKSLRDATFENCLRSGKKWLARTLESAAVRQAIGASPQQWIDINQVFYLAIPVLEAQSIPSEANAATGIKTSSALMNLNYDTLIKDLERLNDILLIARNCLATTQRAQNLAGESSLDHQVLKLIDLCVRVTARGYDGDPPTRAELPWHSVINAYKKLLITCLQFLHNFIMKNEQRKLLLWLDLFASSKVANEYALPPGLRRKSIEPSATDGLGKQTPKVNETDRFSDPEAPKAQDMEVADSTQSREPRAKDLFKQGELAGPSGTATEKSTSIESPRDSEMWQRRREYMEQASRDQPQQKTAAKPDGPLVAESEQETLYGSVKTDKGDEFTALRTPQSAAVTLQAAKDQLMARLADQPLSNEDFGSPDALPQDADGQANGQAPLLAEDEEDFAEHHPGDQQRGLLTDIPLVLGPHEIEALPMIIQIGICPGLGGLLHNRDMQAMRCNILLAGEAGRNLLRELLIFIAAWDLQDEEVYFRLMMQIMEAILENGLMPYAYQTFSEVKDIVSPAQSMVIKILTQIFRGKQNEEAEKGHDRAKTVKSDKTRKPEDPPNPHADASRRVDIYIVRYIFTIFRSSIIPETCALIYLQGQIKAGAALPEDFPLNLWDMERVYEGVYQFLEFFAVLTESEEWKGLLVNWEITSELITLLRELEDSIPKAAITANSIPQTVAESRLAALQQEAQRLTVAAKKAPPAEPAPVAVERPFDIEPTDGSGAAAQNDAYPSLPPAADISEQESIESADPSDFEWRNLKKLVILVLSSLVWKSPTVQNQIRQYGGVEMVLACCNQDANNPYIREHAIMCLRFLLEGCGENKAIVEKLQEAKEPMDELGKDNLSAPGAQRRSERGKVVEE